MVIVPRQVGQGAVWNLKPSDILLRLQDFMIQSMETGDVELLREATQRYKKLEVIHKNCDSTTALAYAKQLFSQTNDFSIMELNDILAKTSVDMQKG